MRLRIYSLAFVALLSVVYVTPASGGYPVKGVQRYRVFQEHYLLATNRVRTWDSEPIRAKTPVHIRLYRHGVEMQQRPINKCAAHYVGGGLVVRVKVINCGTEGKSTYRFRYVSVGGEQRFLLVMSN